MKKPRSQVGPRLVLRSRFGPEAIKTSLGSLETNETSLGGFRTGLGQVLVFSQFTDAGANRSFLLQLWEECSI